ncbi:unnamed protein product [Boreogadus saida]
MGPKPSPKKQYNVPESNSAQMPRLVFIRFIYVTFSGTPPFARPISPSVVRKNSLTKSVTDAEVTKHTIRWFNLAMDRATKRRGGFSRGCGAEAARSHGGSAIHLRGGSNAACKWTPIRVRFADPFRKPRYLRGGSGAEYFCYVGTFQVLPEDDVPLFGGAGDGRESSGDADCKLGSVGLDPRGGAISRTGGTVKLGGPVVEDPDSDWSVSSGSGSAPPSSPTLKARFKLRLARLRLEEAAAIRKEAKEERERDRTFQLSMKNLEVESAFKLRQLELQGSHALGTPAPPCRVSCRPNGDNS